MMFNDVLLTLAVSLLIQAVLFAVAASLKTDKVTDLSYGMTFVVLAGWLLSRGDAGAPAPLALAGMVIAWGVRLAGYLFYRILTIGRDARFDGIREHFWPFFKFWLGQGIAVWVIMLPVTLWFAEPGPWNGLMTAGLIIWAAGFIIETIADAQKFAAKQRPGGEARWVDTGLWAWSRHPNYFGEMLCWWGVYGFVAVDLGVWNALGILGPLSITYILLKVTGIPTLEKSAKQKWGANPEYHAYVARTHRLVPWPGRS
jgi:steroid 5-alpha reductase family enzyme